MDTDGPAGLSVGELRRARRAFVLAQHPDRGGDPAAFAAGLARFNLLLALNSPAPRRRTPTRQTSSHTAAPAAGGPHEQARPRVVVVRRPVGVTGWVRHLAVATGLRRGRPARDLR